MLAIVLPDKVAEYWEPLWQAIEESLPPAITEELGRSNRILESLLIGTMQCWIDFNQEQTEVYAVITTTITQDQASGTKNMLIYSLTVVNPDYEARAWFDGTDVLRKFAKLHKCQNLTGYSKNPRIIKMVDKLGGNADYHFISIKV